jgi:hypothetical protein
MKTPILTTLQQFCAAQDPLPQLEHPWISGLYVYATNRHWMVRTPLDRLSPEEQAFLHATTKALDGARRIEQLAPKAIEYFNNAPWSQLSPMERMECPPCKTCKGGGRTVQTDCPVCRGKGEFKHHGEIYDCESCEGTGHLPVAAPPDATETDHCPNCYGTGLLFEGRSINHRYTYRGNYFALPYLAHLSSLPGIQFGCVPQSTEAPSPPRRLHLSRRL